jgi:hypothetical protein
MKNLFSSLIIVACIIFFVSCSSDPNKLIVGTWRITDVKSTQEVKPEDKKAYDEAMDKMKASTTYNFKSDGTVEEKVNDQSNILKWSITKDGKTLEIRQLKGDDNSVIKENIKELTASKFVWEISSSEVTLTFTMEKK